MDNWDEVYDKGFADRLYADEPEPQSAAQPEPLMQEPSQNKSAPQMQEPSRIPQRPKTYAQAERPMPKQRRQRAAAPKKKLLLLKPVLILLSVLLLLLLAAHFVAAPPMGEASGKTHKENSVTILLAGTDESGDRTDTIMLMNLDRGEKRISLMSIPRDTKVNSRYTPHKINGAYGANGAGEEGMEALMDYVSECVGFRPDGYMLLELDVFIDLVELMGDVGFEVPCDMDYEDPSQDLYIHLKQGYQKLNGEQAMGLVRFRSGYSMADITRVSVQRDFMMAAMSQWSSWTKVWKLPFALRLLTKNSLTDLTVPNLLWLAETAAICGTKNMEMMTIPFYLDDMYVIIDDDAAYYSMINEHFDPYEEPISRDDTNIAS